MPASLAAHTAAASTNGTSVTTTAINTTGATLLVVAVAANKAVTPTLADSAGNTWTQVIHHQAALNDSLTVFYCSSSPLTGASHTFTPSGSGSYLPAIAVQAFSGTPNGTVPEINESGATSGGSDTVTFTAATPLFSDELLVSFAAANTGKSLSIDSGFTVTDGLVGVTSQAWGLAGAWTTQTTPQSVSPTWTTTGTFPEIAAGLLSFQANPPFAQQILSGRNSYH